MSALPFRSGLGANRDAFDVPPGTAYFNTANLAPLLHSVRSAGQAALARRARPWTITADDWFDGAEQARALFGAVVGADPDGVALVPATSYGLAVAAGNLPLRPGDRIVVLAQEYPSGIYTWRAAAARTGAVIHTVSRADGQSWTDAVIDALDERVAVLSVPQVHWTDGALVELDRVADAARRVGARLVVDASQSVGAMPLDVGRIRPDFLVSVGYKWLLGPFGLGYLYVAEEHRDGTPLEQNWILRANARDFAGLVDYCDDYQPGSRRYDVGERTSFETMPMAVAALRQLIAWRVPAIASALADVTDRIAAGAQALGLAVQRPTGPHLLGVTLRPGLRPAAVMAALRSSGCHVAQRGSALRISPHLHVTAGDIDTLLRALSRAVNT
jgi:selenocysteine lyase/cysteine desulfurase